MRSTEHKAPHYVVLSTPGLSRTLNCTDGDSLRSCRKTSYTDFSAPSLTAHHSHRSVTTKRIHLTPCKTRKHYRHHMARKESSDIHFPPKGHSTSFLIHGLFFSFTESLKTPTYCSIFLPCAKCKAYGNSMQLSKMKLSLYIPPRYMAGWRYGSTHT